jgi:enoyl-CoA hydratase/carnithine racemase
MTRSPDPNRPYLIGLNEVQVGLAVPESVQHLMRRTVGQRWSERLLLFGAMIPAEQALQIGLVDELADKAETTSRAIAWLEALSKLPRQPMLQTRTTMRADLIDALHPDNLRLEQALLDTWYQTDTQTALHALAARLEKYKD